MIIWKIRSILEMGLIFSLLEDYGLEHHLDDFSIDKSQSFIIITWLVQVLWVVVMLATVWSFVLGTLAPFKRKTVNNRQFLSGNPHSFVFYDSVVYNWNNSGSYGKENVQNGIRKISNIRIEIMLDKVKRFTMRDLMFRK